MTVPQNKTQASDKTQALDSDLLAQFAVLVGERYALFQEDEKAKFLVEWRG